MTSNITPEAVAAIEPAAQVEATSTVEPTVAPVAEAAAEAEKLVEPVAAEQK